jgi:hypothetical protein
MAIQRPRDFSLRQANPLGDAGKQFPTRGRNAVPPASIAGIRQQALARRGQGVLGKLARRIRWNRANECLPRQRIIRSVFAAAGSYPRGARRNGAVAIGARRVCSRHDGWWCVLLSPDAAVRIVSRAQPGTYACPLRVPFVPPPTETIGRLEPDAYSAYPTLGATAGTFGLRPVSDPLDC